MSARHDIQGNILRGYASHLNAAYLLTRVGDAGDARGLLSSLLTHDRIATERDWGDPPATRLNVAFTPRACRRWRSTRRRLRAFPTSARACTARARTQLGDLGDNDPANWESGTARGDPCALHRVRARGRAP